MRWAYFIGIVLMAVLTSGYVWTQLQTADPREAARFYGLALSCGVCCIWPLMVGAGGWWLRKIVHEGWRPSLAPKTKQEEL